jgi:hypothetical protein
MRLLTDYEVNLVAGGWGSSSFVYDDIIITGHRLESMSWAFDVVPYTDGGGGGGVSTSPQDAEHQQTEDSDDTPCVDELPAGVTDLGHLNDLAKALATHLAALQDVSDWEWAAFIYKGTDGQLYQSEPFTAGHHGDVDGASISLPRGAEVVAYLHTHPDGTISAWSSRPS